MKAIELMQRIGELVAAHGDIEVILGTYTGGGFDYDSIRRVMHKAVEAPNYPDINYIEISAWK